MGQLALAAKITHVPSLYLSELPGDRHGTRQDAIDGHREIGRRCRELGVDNPAVFFEQHGVGLSDGKDFGAPGFVRLNFGCSRALPKQGLARMQSAVATLAK